MMDRLKEMDRQKLKWMIVLAVLMVIGIFGFAFMIVAIRVGSLIGLLLFGVMGVGAFAAIIRVFRKKFGDLDLD